MKVRQGRHRKTNEPEKEVVEKANPYIFGKDYNMMGDGSGGGNERLVGNGRESKAAGGGEVEEKGSKMKVKMKGELAESYGSEGKCRRRRRHNWRMSR